MDVLQTFTSIERIYTKPAIMLRSSYERTSIYFNLV